MLKMKYVVVPILLAISVLSGCGAKGSTQTIHTNQVDLAVSLTPTPLMIMQSERITIQFLKDGKAVDVQNAFIDMTMPSMTMDEKVQLSQVAPGKFQGDYHFSMTGNWVEKIHFTVGNQLEIATQSLEVKN